MGITKDRNKLEKKIRKAIAKFEDKQNFDIKVDTVIVRPRNFLGISFGRKVIITLK